VAGAVTVEGGLVGKSDGGTISLSYATGAVSGYAGGLIGGASGTEIADCYAEGSATGAVQAGGFAAGMDRESTILRSYAIGQVSNANKYRGGFTGYYDSSTLENDYWDLDTSSIGDPSLGCGNTPNCSGVTGLTDAQLKSGLPPGFDPNVWAQDPSINNGYPYLLANPPPK
jgi:hypothetical protein